MITMFSANTPESSKICQKVEVFFLLNAPKYLGVRHFYSFYGQTLRIFWNLFLSKKDKNKKQQQQQQQQQTVKHKRLPCKDNFSLV